MSEAVVTAVAVTSTPTLEGGRVVVSDAAAATVTTGVAVGAAIAIDGPPPRQVSPHDASSMLEKRKYNKDRTENIDIQAFDAILQLGVRYRLMA